MKVTLLTICAFFYVFTVNSQVQGDGGTPKSYKLQGTKSVPTIKFVEPDIAALRQEDAIVDAEKSGPWRFGYNNETNISMTNAGSWTVLPNGGKIWRVKMECKNALTINLTLENVVIPEGNELYVYNEDKSFILGKFTDYHLYKGTLGTELVPGNTVVAEYYVAPKNVSKTASLTISRVTHGYRTANEFTEKAFGSSGSCNMNVNCPDGAAWEAQKRGAVMLVSGSNGFCSGALINNTQNDGKPYVLTANHCYSNPTNWIFRFHWESATCSNPGSSPTFESLSGAVLRARRTPSDFCLVEITGGLVGGTVPSSLNTYFAGWDNSGTNPSTTVSIHHPAGDIKKISFDDAAASPIQAMGSSEANSSWAVEWDRNTTTEGGSSGSPLYDQAGRIIGQLWGGGASCSNLSAPDYYGRVSNSWEPSGSNSTNQLKFWLDPTGSGVTVIDGYDPNNPPAPDNAGINSISSPSGNYCTGSITPVFVLRNFGNNNLTSVTINYNIDGGANSTMAWTGNLAPGTNETITLPAMTVADGSHVFNAFTSMPNGTADTGTSNDASSSTFITTANGQMIDISVTTDCWGDETTWELQNTSGTMIAANNGQLADETTIVTQVCIGFGCYNFVISDSFGDGMEGSAESNCDVDGTYEITDQFGNVLASIIQVNFGDEETNNFCLNSNANVNSMAKNQFKLYPNPSNGSFTISFNELKNNTVITVTDLSGRTIYETPVSDAISEIILSNVAAGNYLVNVSTDEFSSTQSIQINN